MKLRFATLPLLLSAACAAHAQTAEIEVNDGTTATCYQSGGAAPCSSFTKPTIDTRVDDGAGQSSEINTTTAATWIQTNKGTSSSGLNIIGEATALESYDAAIGYGAAGTQVGTSAFTGLPSGQFVATGENTSNQDSTLQLEGTAGLLRTRDATASTAGFFETATIGTKMGYVDSSGDVSTITSDATGHHILGNTDLDGTLSVTGASTLNGIDNQGGGITNAGTISGVTAGAVTATSTEAVNGSQLYKTEQLVATAQTTADTALANAATAQTTADTAVTNAATAQTTADTAVTNAAAAQTTADTALANAATAQTTADTAVTNAATAQTTADTAVTNAATAQTTANTAQTTATAAATEAATAHSVADTANANATTAQATANTAQATANTAIGNSAQALTVANSANTTAINAYGMATALSGRVSDLETNVRKLNDDIEHVDQMAGRGIAIATSLASIPDLEPGKTAGLGVGVGSYDGRNAVSAAFVVRANENLKLRVNGGTAGDGKFAFGAGGMLSW